MKRTRGRHVTGPPEGGPYIAERRDRSQCRLKSALHSRLQGVRYEVNRRHRLPAGEPFDIATDQVEGAFAAGVLEPAQHIHEKRRQARGGKTRSRLLLRERREGDRPSK